MNENVEVGMAEKRIFINYIDVERKHSITFLCYVIN